MAADNTRCEIKVDGEAELMLPPERAVLKIAVKTTSKDKSESTSGTIDSARQVESLVRRLSEKTSSSASLPAIDYWSRTSLSETSQTPYRESKFHPEEFTAQVDFRIQLQTFRRLGSLIHDLVAVAHVSSRGVEWILTPETQAAQRARLRDMAARDAVAKARDFADALGFGKVWPCELHGGKQYTQSSAMKGGSIRREKQTMSVQTQGRNMAEGEAGEWEDVAEEAFQYAPEDVKMTQSVSARFWAE